MLAGRRETDDHIVSTTLKDASVSPPLYIGFKRDEFSLCYNTLLVYVLLSHVLVALCYFWHHLVAKTYFLLFFEQILCRIIVTKSCLSL